VNFKRRENKAIYEPEKEGKVTRSETGKPYREEARGPAGLQKRKFLKENFLFEKKGGGTSPQRREGGVRRQGSGRRGGSL